MSHICPPCSSIVRPDCRPARPESCERRRAPPFRKTLQWDNPETFLRLFRRARFGTWPWTLLHLLDDLLKLRRHFWNGLAPDLHFASWSLTDHDIARTELVVLGGKVITEMRSPAFFSLERRPSHHFRDSEQVIQVDGRMPAGVVFAITSYANAFATDLEFSYAFQRLRHFFFRANDAHQVLHHVLQSVLNRIGPFATIMLEGFQRLFFCGGNFVSIDGAEGALLGVGGSVLASAFSENQQIGERVPAEPVRAMQPRPALDRKSTR